MTRLTPALVLLAVLLAGCVHAPGPRDASLPRSTPEVLLLSACHGVHASAAPLPSPLAPAQPPPGWGAGPETSSISVWAYACERLSLGRFERGPIHVVLESHGNFTPPPACAADSGNVQRFLLSLQVDDADVADHLRSTYGLPASFAHVTVTDDDVATVPRHAWAWGPPGVPPSDLAYPEDGRLRNATILQRVFWADTANPSAVGVLDLVGTAVLDSASLAGVGTMHEPMALARQPPAGLFTGTTTPFRALDAAASLQRFSDASCQVRA